MFNYNFKPNQQKKAYIIMSKIMNDYHNGDLATKQVINNNAWNSVYVLNSVKAVKLFKNAISDIKIDNGKSLNSTTLAEIKNNEKFIKIASNHPKWYWYIKDILSNIHLITYPKADEIKTFIIERYDDNCSKMRELVNKCMDKNEISYLYKHLNTRMRGKLLGMY